MNPSNPAHTLMPASIRFNLLLPAAQLSFGIFSFDPLTLALGRPLEQVLAPILAGHPGTRPVQGGNLRVYPLQLPLGMGVTLPLGRLGEFGVMNDDGMLKLTVPAGLVGWLSTVAFRVHGPVPDAGANGVPVAAAWLRIPVGQCLTIPIEMIGAIILEAA